MKILVFGGTTEGRLLAERLPGQGHLVTVSVATALGAEELRGTECRIMTGRLDREQMAALVQDYDLVIDATHPYAAEASRNIQAACGIAAVSLRRVLREPSEMTDCIPVDSCEQAAAYLENRTGNVLIATGSKNLAAYGSLDPARLYPRVLPTHEALDVCLKLGIPHRNILAMQGPFSEEMNRAMLRQYHIRFLVTKDGGAAGGFEEKRRAAQASGAAVILVRRPTDAGVSLERLLAELEAKT